MEKDSIKSLREQVTREIQEEKLKMACAYPTRSVESPPVLAREEMVTYKHMRNLADLPLGSTHTVTAIGYIAHYGQEKLTGCQAGRWHIIPGWRQFEAAERTVRK